MSKILVTGASGFIGKHLMNSLADRQHELFGAKSADGDVADMATWNKYPVADIVVHLAGKSFVPDSWKDPEAFVKCNLLGTLGALNYCREHKAHLILLSSYLYGNAKTQPIAETTPLVVNNPYMLSKKLGEDVCDFYAKSFDMPITILRPFNIYGYGQDPNFLIPSIISQISRNETIKVKDLEPKRDYLFVTDLVNAIIKAIETRSRGVFNVGSGKSYSVAELIAVIQECTKTTLPVSSENIRRKEEVMDTIADISKAQSILGWTPAYSLSEGIAEILKAK